MTPQPAVEESDSEDEMPINTVGNIPLEWYDEFDHVGYDLDGQKILRSTRKDELDALSGASTTRTPRAPCTTTSTAWTWCSRRRTSR